MFIISRVTDKVETAITDYAFSQFNRKMTLAMLSDGLILSNDHIFRRTLIKIMQFITRHDPSVEFPVNFKDIENSEGYISFADMFSVVYGKHYLIDNTIISFEKEQASSADTVQWHRYIVHLIGICATPMHKLFTHYYNSGFLTRMQQSANTKINFTYPTLRVVSSTGNECTLLKEVSYMKKLFPEMADLMGKGVQEVDAQIKKFLGMRHTYEKYHVNYSLNMLLSGVPGTGKTSVIKAIAKSYHLKVYVVTSRTDIFEFVTSARDNIYENAKLPALVLFEEIDEILKSPSKKGDTSNNNLEFIMQYLDGLYSVSNTINILTTNHPEVLDTRFMRKGRIDHHIVFKNLTLEEAVTFSEKFSLPRSTIMRILNTMETDKEERFNPSEIEAKIIEYIRESKLK